MHALRFAALCVFVLSPLLLADDLTIVTSGGTVRGIALATGVRQWLGIPFAATTGGENRWMPPQSAPAFNKVFHAKAFGDTCFQNLNAANEAFLVLTGQSAPLPTSEDCLSLNIWAPPTFRPQNTAVMIWMYGGSMEFGSSSIDVYNGENFVRDNDDVIIVSFNYRTNIFSAPTAPQLANGPGNFGILDRDAAINWVHANIAAFGGDPDRIVLFGESAGALLADAFTFAYPDDTVVKGIILESGNAELQRFMAPKNTDNTSPTSQWNTIAQEVGCGTAGDATQWTCMKAVPAHTLESAVLASNLGFSMVADGIMFFNDTASRLANGQFLKVPTLLGHNANEGDSFAVIQQLLLTNTTDRLVTETISLEMTQLVFGCPAAASAAGRSKAHVPTFRYRYEAFFPDISSRPELRAYHSSEVPIVFGTYNLSILPAAPTPNEIKLSKFIQSAWVAFARNPATGLQRAPFNWPIYDPNTATLGELGGSSNLAGVHFTIPAPFDINCTV